MTSDWFPDEGTPLPDAAGIYAQNGWSVFPCKGKEPATPHGFRDATTDAQTIAGWWRANNRNNIGWALPSGLMALDVDRAHGGIESLRELERELGALPQTLCQLTGADGWHFIYRVPKDVELRQGTAFKPGLDTRIGGRGYILVAPSIHPVTRRPYQWRTITEPAPIPGWLIELIRKPSPKPATNLLPNDSEGPRREDLDQRIFRARRYLEKMSAGISGSGGHAATFRAALVLVRGFELPDHIAFELLVDDFNPRCAPPWSEKDLRHKIAQARDRSILESGWLLDDGGSA